MNYPAAVNGFIHSERSNSMVFPAGNIKMLHKDGLKVHIISTQEQIISALCAHLSALVDVGFYCVYNDVEEMILKQAGNAHILIADAGLLNRDTIKQLKLLAPGVVIIAIADNAGQQQDVFNYLRPPVVFGDVFFLMAQAKIYLNTGNATVETGKKNFVLIKSEYRLIKIDFSNILFVAGMKDYIKIWLKDKSTPVTTLQNLKEFERKLPAQDFIRVHKSYIVAFAHIDCIARNEIMIGSYSIPVGDAFRNGLNDFIHAYT